MAIRFLITFVCFLLMPSWISLRADENSSLTEEEQKLIEERTKKREQLRTQMDFPAQSSLDAKLRFEYASAEDLKKIENLLIAGANPDYALEREVHFSWETDSAFGQIVSSKNKLSLEALELLFKYGGKFQPVQDFEDLRHNTVGVVMQNQIAVLLLLRALFENIEEDDLSNFRALVKLLKKYGCLKIKGIHWDTAITEFGTAYMCTVGAYFWMKARQAKADEKSAFCKYRDHVLGDNWEFIKTIWNTTFDSLPDKYAEISNSWTKTRNQIQPARQTWRDSIQNSNFWISLAMAVDPEQKEKCEPIKRK